MHQFERELNEQLNWVNAHKLSFPVRCLHQLAVTGIQLSKFFRNDLPPPPLWDPRNVITGTQYGDEYRDKGYVIGKKTLADDTLIEKLFNDTRRINEHFKYLSCQGIQYLNANVVDLAYDPNIVELIRSVYQTDNIRFYHATLHYKPPGATGTPWHIDSNQVLSARIWVPLCDTNKNNGCLRIAERSHNFLDQEFSNIFYKFSKITRFNLTTDEYKKYLRAMHILMYKAKKTPELAAWMFFSTTMYALWCHLKNSYDEKSFQKLISSVEIKDIEMCAGEILLFTTSVVHSAYANTSENWRPSVGLFYSVDKRQAINNVDFNYFFKSHNKAASEWIQSCGITKHSYMQVYGSANSPHAIEHNSFKEKLSNWAHRGDYQHLKSI